MWRETKQTTCLSGIAAVCLLAAMQTARAAPADPFLSTIAGVKKAIGAVVCVKPHPGSQRFSPFIVGTAFFISRSGEFLTAAHVIRDFYAGGDVQNCPMEVWFSQGPQEPGHVGFQMFPVSRCVSDDRVDVARCATVANLAKLTDVKFKPQTVAIDGSPRPDGTAIAVTGYPLSSMLPITSRGFLGASQLDVYGEWQIILDRAAWPGGSGSPVYDSAGKAIGLVTEAGEGRASGISFARGSASIVHFLATHPLPPASPSVPPPATTPAPATSPSAASPAPSTSPAATKPSGG